MNRSQQHHGPGTRDSHTQHKKYQTWRGACCTDLSWLKKKKHNWVWVSREHLTTTFQVHHRLSISPHISAPMPCDTGLLSASAGGWCSVWGATHEWAKSNQKLLRNVKIISYLLLLRSLVPKAAKHRNCCHYTDTVWIGYHIICITQAVKRQRRGSYWINRIQGANA